MPLINAATSQLFATLLYYGPSMAGKTANLRFIQQRAMPHEPQALRSWVDHQGRTALFDHVALPFGVQRGLHTTIHLFATPGADEYAHTRAALLTNVDGIVFVVDSRPHTQDANLASWYELRAAVREHGLNDVPVVLQFNHRDAADALPADVLQAQFDATRPHVLANAAGGMGVLATLKAITHSLLAPS